MKSSRRLSKKCVGGLCASALGLVSIGTTRGEIYVATGGDNTVSVYNLNGSLVNPSLVSGVSPFPGNSLEISGTNLFVANTNGSVSEYALAGGTVNPSLLPGLFPLGISVAGSAIYVTEGTNAANNFTHTVGAYTTSGDTINSSLISSGTDTFVGIAVSGPNLFIVNTSAGTIDEYTTAGAAVRTAATSNPLISGLGSPTAIAISGQNIFVSNRDLGTVGEYTLSGTTVNASLISGLTHPTGVAVSGSSLYVADATLGTVGQYTLNGAAVNASLITGLSGPQSIAIAGQAASVAPTDTQTTVSAGNSYATVAPVTSAGGLSTTTSIVGGTSSGKTVTLSTTNLATQFKSLASDVVSVTGNAGDVFALQLTFDLNAVNEIGGADAARLLWLNPASGHWTNAVNGDIGTNTTNPLYLNYQGSFADFEAANGITASTNLSPYLGAYGVDAVNDTVWAIIDHNSNFGTGDFSQLPEGVPEPSGWMVLVVGGMGLVGFGRVRRGRG